MPDQLARGWLQHQIPPGRALQPPHALHQLLKMKLLSTLQASHHYSTAPGAGYGARNSQNIARCIYHDDLKTRHGNLLATHLTSHVHTLEDVLGIAGTDGARSAVIMRTMRLGPTAEVVT